jgi:hypothetical protein
MGETRFSNATTDGPAVNAREPIRPFLIRNGGASAVGPPWVDFRRSRFPVVAGEAIEKCRDLKVQVMAANEDLQPPRLDPRS